jgi:hypothetical protein
MPPSIRPAHPLCCPVPQRWVRARLSHSTWTARALALSGSRASAIPPSVRRECSMQAAHRRTDSAGWTSYWAQKTTYASPTTARPASDATTATEVIRFACFSSHSSPSDTSGCRATARRRSLTIPRNRHPKRAATPKNTSAGTISRRAPQPAEMLATSSDSSSHGFARCRVDDNAGERDRPTRATPGQPLVPSPRP